MKLAVVVQRYGADLNGGAELHARYIAERLSRHADVEVLTTCARDYITWRNELPAGTDSVNGLSVKRFKVSRERSPSDFGRLSQHVFGKLHSIADELNWLQAEGPTSPELIDYLLKNKKQYDYVIFFSYRYYHAYHGIRVVPQQAILVPTAERDPALGLAIFKPTFRAVRAVMYNSYEEQSLIHKVSKNQDVPGVVVGVGSEVPETASAERFRHRTGITDDFLLYVGRIDENKGCAEMFDYFQRYSSQVSAQLKLVLIGNPVMTIPKHTNIKHLGFVTEEEKYDAMAAATVLLMPSYFESLSMVTIEAWAMNLPVIVNGKCDVLRGQTIRANGGLYYESYGEFAESLHALETNRDLRVKLASNGRNYYKDNYTWDVIEQKYVSMLDQLEADNPHKHETVSGNRLGWFERRRRICKPAQDIVDRLPTGPVLNSIKHSRQKSASNNP
ncbi:MAG: glycosyltransferase family 4 protein [Vicinamibacterales bacterium]